MLKNVRNYNRTEIIDLIGKEVVYKGNSYEITHVEIHPFYYKVFLWNLKNGSDRISFQESKAKVYLNWPDGSAFGVRMKKE